LPTRALTKDIDVVTENVRTAMGRTICRQYQNDRGETAGHQLLAGARGEAGGCHRQD